MITAVEKGRHLIITVGEGEESEQFTIAPVDVKTGAQLLVHWLGMLSIESAEDAHDAARIAQNVAERTTEWAKLAAGEANYNRVQHLRQQEASDVINAAFFWNAQGGGTEAMQAYLDGGLGKAMQVVFGAAGLLPTQR